MKKLELEMERCPTMSAVQRVLGGKWKIELLYYISVRNMRRFGELRRQIGEISESALTKQLRELEMDGFLIRHDYKEVPPHVEYTLTDLGQSFIPILDTLKQWGDEHIRQIS